MNKPTTAFSVLKRVTAIVMCAIISVTYMPLSGFFDGQAYAQDGEETFGKLFDIEHSHEMLVDNEWRYIEKSYGDYTITSVEVINQKDENGNDADNILGLERYDEWGWEYWAEQALGSATLRISYTDPNGTPGIYDFYIQVADDVYRVHPVPSAGSFSTLPEKEIEFLAFFEHRHAECVECDDENPDTYWIENQVDDADDLVWEWSVSGPDGMGNTIQGKGQTATLEVGVLPEGVEDAELSVRVTLKDASGKVLAEGQNEIWVADSYFELWPTILDEEIRQMDVGDSHDVTAEVRCYGTDLVGSEGNTVDYVLVDGEKVNFTWDYDPERVSITNAGGQEMANITQPATEEGPAEYNFTTASGNGLTFKITRLREEWNSDVVEEAPDIRLIAEYATDEGDIIPLEGIYNLSQKRYNYYLSTKDCYTNEDAYSKVFPDQSIIVYPKAYDDTDFNMGSEYSMSYRVCTYDWETDKYTDIESKAYTVNNDNTITLHGEKLSKEYGDGEEITVIGILKKGEKELAERYKRISITEEVKRAGITESQDVIRGNSIYIDSSYWAEVCNKDNPNGMHNIRAVVTNAELVQVGDTAASEILELYNSGNNEDDGGTWFNAKDYGTAIIRVTYDIHQYEWNEENGSYDIGDSLGESFEGLTHDMRVNVKSELFRVEIESENGAWRKTPNSELNLEAVVNHEVEEGEEGNLEGVSYEWSLIDYDGAAVDESIAKITPDSSDPSKAKVSFVQLPENENYWGFFATVKVMKNDEIVAEDDFQLEMRREYTELEPSRIDEFELGESREVTVAAKCYDAGHPNGMPIQDATFEWRGWGLDNFEISEPTNNNDGTFTYTIRRIGPGAAELKLIAEWVDKNDHEEPYRSEERTYYFNEINYNICFEDADPWDVFVDGDKSLTANIEGYNDFEAASEAGFELEFAAGIFDWARGSWSVEFKKNEEYSVQGNDIVLHGTKLTDYVYQDVTIFVSLSKEGNVISEDNRSLHVRAVEADYRFPSDRYMLIGWDGWISGKSTAWVVNAENPRGKDIPYTVTDVSFMDNYGPNDERTLEIEGPNHNGDWRYIANNYGDAVMFISYIDINGSEQRAEVFIKVSPDIYEVNIEDIGGSYKARPGDVVSLKANVRHESDTNNSIENVVYDWNEEAFENNYGDYATLTVDDEDRSLATLTFNDLDDMPEDIRNGWQVSVCPQVTIYDGLDENEQPIWRADSYSNILLSDSYSVVAPYTINRRLGVGGYELITAELRDFPGEDGEPYWLRENVHFRWYYNPESIEIRDAEGNVVGNNYEGTYEYVDSDASYGRNPTFTIKRLKNTNERFELRVDFSDEGGGWHECEWREYWFDELDYNIWFEDDHKEVNCESNSAVAFTLNKTDELKDAGDIVSVVYEVGEWDGENHKWNKRLTVPAEEFELTASGLKINKDKALERGIHDVGIRAIIKCGDDEYRDAWAWLHIEDHDWDDGEKTEDPTCTDNGVITYTCKKCQTERKESSIDALGHSMTHHAAVPATCESAGNLEYWSCSRCEKNFADVDGVTGLDSIVTSALGHDYGEWTVTKEPTCTEKGSREKVCSHDNTHKVTEELDTIAHTPGEAIHENEVAATCETGGSYDEIVKCTVCGAEISNEHKTTGPLDHDYGEWTVTKEPTCTEKGSREKVCSHDNTHKVTEELDKIAHTPGEAIHENEVAATCETGGSYDEIVKCTVCGAEISNEHKTTGPLGHAYKWTEVDENQHEGECEHCDAPKVIENHIWDAGKVTKAASYTEPGIKTYTCTVCKATKTESVAKLTYPAGSDPNQMGEGGKAVGAGASAVAAEKAITTSASEEGPAGSKFSVLQLKSTSQTATSTKLTWASVKGATKYVIYGNACGKKNKLQKIGETKAKSMNVKKFKGAALKKDTYYKFMVVALNSKNEVISTSKVIHVATNSKKAGNPTKITFKKPKTLKKGKTHKLAAKQSGKKVKKHRGLTYETTNAKIATVNAKGVITAKGKGTCYVYIYAQNGLFKKVKVTVK